MQEQQRAKFKYLGLNIAYYRKEKGFPKVSLRSRSISAGRT